MFYLNAQTETTVNIVSTVSAKCSKISGKLITAAKDTAKVITSDKAIALYKTSTKYAVYTVAAVAVTTAIAITYAVIKTFQLAWGLYDGYRVAENRQAFVDVVTVEARLQWTIAVNCWAIVVAFSLPVIEGIKAVVKAIAGWWETSAMVNYQTFTAIVAKASQA